MAKAARVTQAISTHFHRHGGRLDDARVAWPHAPEPWLDLSTGINPRGWLPPSPLAIDPAALPAAAALARLERRAARFFGTDAARVVAVPGSEIALRLLGALGLPEPITALRPSYGTHKAVAAREIGHDALDDMVGEGGTILLANPNNPDGRRHDPATLRALAARHGASGGWLVIDEAFADATPDDSVSPGLDADHRIVVLRSFGKFFGLAGLRLGFLVAPPVIAARMRALMGDWPVAAHTLAWGGAAYADAAWIATTRNWLATTAARLDALLARHGLRPGGASPLFRLIEHPDAAALFNRLAHAGILTRPFADQPHWLRFGLPADAADFDRLDRALAHG